MVLPSSSMLWYLYPPPSVSVISSLFGKYLPSHQSFHSLRSKITVHFVMLNSILMSLLHCQAALINWSNWPNGWVFVYELSVSGFESSCSHLNFRFHAGFEQGFPWHSGNYRVWIHSEMCTWHDKNIQSAFFLVLNLVILGRLRYPNTSSSRH